LVPGFEPTGEHWFDWVLHDGGYRGTLEVWRDGSWQNANMPQLQCDQLLDRSLAMRGTNRFARFAVYRTLRAVGHNSYRKDK